MRVDVDVWVGGCVCVDVCACVRVDVCACVRVDVDVDVDVYACERTRAGVAGGVGKEEIWAERLLHQWVCLRGTMTRVLGNNRMPESVAGGVQV